MYEWKKPSREKNTSKLIFLMWNIKKVELTISKSKIKVTKG